MNRIIDVGTFINYLNVLDFSWLLLDHEIKLLVVVLCKLIWIYIYLCSNRQQYQRYLKKKRINIVVNVSTNKHTFYKLVYFVFRCKNTRCWECLKLFFFALARLSYVYAMISNSLHIISRYMDTYPNDTFPESKLFLWSQNVLPIQGHPFPVFVHMYLFIIFVFEEKA